MSVWIRNLSTALEDRPVVILHGNVRDKYIDERSRVYENLTTLLNEIAEGLPLRFAETVFYDTIGQERRVAAGQPPGRQLAVSESDPELDETAARSPEAQPGARPTAARVMSAWLQELSATECNRFFVLFYLDKLVSYKQQYQDSELEMLLRIEKLIENISPNNRLIMVALQDTLVPTELYTNSPKTRVHSIPIPGKAERQAYLKHRLGASYKHQDLITGLTDGLFLRDLGNMIPELSGQPDLPERDVRRLVNRYRIGEQEDYFGALDIEYLSNAATWFVETGSVKGQDEAIRRVVDTLVLARAGLAGTATGVQTKPQGTLFFAGPTGVGKTLLARKIADFLFKTEEAFIRFDMSEFKEEHTTSKLIGSPPGYVGYDKGGVLTNAVRERPFCVILFDEVEKAHPKIMDIFLQLLDEGRLTDSRGQTVFFTETIIIFTSNLGTRTTDIHGHSSSERSDLDQILADASSEERKARIREHFANCVNRFFMFEISRPELLNRIGNNIVAFNYIDSQEVQASIVDSLLNTVKSEVEDDHRASGHTIQIDSSVCAHVVKRYGRYISEFGGRAVASAVRDDVLLPLSYALLRSEHSGRRNVTFVLSADVGTGTVSVTER